jgi:hypothetical protein
LDSEENHCSSSNSSGEVLMRQQQQVLKQQQAPSHPSSWVLKCRNPSFNYSGKENALSPYIEAKHIHLQATAQMLDSQGGLKICKRSSETACKLQ